jgi:hypothetical protein
MPTQDPAKPPGYEQYEEHNAPQNAPAKQNERTSVVDPAALPPKPGAQTAEDVARMRGEVQAENYGAQAASEAQKAAALQSALDTQKRAADVARTRRLLEAAKLSRLGRR